MKVAVVQQIQSKNEGGGGRKKVETLHIVEGIMGMHSIHTMAPNGASYSRTQGSSQTIVTIQKQPVYE